VPKMSEEDRQRAVLARARKVALAAEEEDLRLEQRRQHWVRDGIYLSWAELEAGEPCRGCGQPILDDLVRQPPLASWPGVSC
jgi:hypothetical protein